MVPSESKVVKLITPQTLAAASTTTAHFDTKGYDYCTIDIMDGSVATATTAITYLQVAEGDTAITAYTSLTGSIIIPLTGGTATSATAGFVCPQPSTATVVPTGCNYRLNIDLKGRKRWLFLEFTPAHASSIAAWATLYRCEDGPAMSTISPITNSTAIYQSHLNVSV